jgi:hypothetical protein
MRWYSAESAESLVVTARQMAKKFDGPRLTNLLPITNAKVHLHPQRYN